MIPFTNFRRVVVASLDKKKKKNLSIGMKTR